MATVLDIEVVFRASDENGNVRESRTTFQATNSSLQTEVDDYAEEFVSDLNDEDDDREWSFDEYEIEGYDADFADPDDFSDLDGYGEYAEKVEEHGEAYALRHADIGDFDFDDGYCGCWDSAEDYVESFYGDCYEIPDHLASYIDWEKLTRDVMMDYSEYTDSSGEVHIFRD